MLNRIRRAVSLTRERHFPGGRHRRPLTASGPSAAPAAYLSPDRTTVVRRRASDDVDHRSTLRGEDIALVRPYVLAWEKRVRTREVVVAPYLPADAWSTLVGAR
ncbi:hypothetical protein GCM10010269_81890 [Streptomyces humidus]|uniref:Uncharacterized protein n=1 Tax=Streptomyces humidus TaxID=52259 RepID=A0A918GEN5_9ACTN|nr:hypothetical protein GCM10010269_81890 [Streptomyces humidus]